MSTTLLFVELLIVGLQVCVWIFMLTIIAFGTNWFQAIKSSGLSDWSTLLTILILSFAYSFGIIVDRLADKAFSKWEKRLRKKITPDYPYTTKMKIELGEKYKIFENQFEYTKSRLRIARASSLNFGISTILAFLLILVRFKTTFETNWVLLLVTSGIGIAITAGAIFSWAKLTKTYLGLVESAYKTHASPRVQPLSSDIQTSETNITNNNE